MVSKKISLNFDLKQSELWNNGFSKGTEIQAYELIKKSLKKLGYVKRQHSRFYSETPVKTPTRTSRGTPTVQLDS